MFLWRISAADSNKIYLDFILRLLSDFKQIWNVSTGSHRSRDIKFHVSPSSGSLADTCGQKDRQQEAKRRFSRFSNAPKIVLK